MRLGGLSPQAQAAATIAQNLAPGRFAVPQSGQVRGRERAAVITEFGRIAIVALGSWDRS